jgi:hypothetical protein
MCIVHPSHLLVTRFRITPMVVPASCLVFPFFPNLLKTHAGLLGFQISSSKFFAVGAGTRTPPFIDYCPKNLLVATTTRIIWAELETKWRGSEIP